MSTKQKGALILIFLLPFALVDVIRYFAVPDHQNIDKRIEVLIPAGATVSQIADTLVNHGLIEDQRLFIFWAKSLGKETRLKAGLYQVPEGLTYPQLVSYLTTGRQKEIFVTLIEGWNNKQIAEALSEKFSIDPDKFMALCSDSAFIRSLGIEQGNLRGYLLPDTYAFVWGIDEASIIKYLVGKTLELFESDSARAAMAEYGMDVHKILTLASIIEGEVIFDRERGLVASVYYNRLEKGMRLQACPTVQFLLPGKPRRLLLKDLKIQSPYNTYIHYGLPPGPINNPGKKSILATLFPEKTNYLYFVAKGDGSHVFSRSAAAHARAKADFQEIRRDVRRNQR